MNTEALYRSVEALELSLSLARSLAKDGGRLLRAKRFRPESRAYVEEALHELKTVHRAGEEVARALADMDAVLREAELARVFELPVCELCLRPYEKRKAHRLAGTGREENFDTQTVAPAAMPVNAPTPGDAARRQEVGDAH